MKKAIQDIPAKAKRLEAKAVKIKRSDPADIKSYDRFTFVGHFVFEHFGEAPIAQEFRTQAMLDYSYQPVVRRLVVDAKETPIDTQWIPADHTGYLVLENRAGAGMLTTPTVEELEELKQMIVRVKYKGAKKGFLVRPGGLFLASPEDAGELVMQAVNSPVNVNMYLVSL